jgi:hypothetical protein
MPIKKDFKVINDETENAKHQEEITISESEAENVKRILGDFFSSTKTLLREGAVIIDDEKMAQDEEEDLSAEILNDPENIDKGMNLYKLAALAIGGKKGRDYLENIKGIKMTSEYKVEIEFKKPGVIAASALKTLENSMEKEIKSYIKELPAIMQERSEKMQLLLGVRPDIKKYLESSKKSN